MIKVMHILEMASECRRYCCHQTKIIKCPFICHIYFWSFLIPKVKSQGLALLLIFSHSKGQISRSCLTFDLFSFQRSNLKVLPYFWSFPIPKVKSQGLALLLIFSHSKGQISRSCTFRLRHIFNYKSPAHFNLNCLVSGYTGSKGCCCHKIGITTCAFDCIFSLTINLCPL